MKTKIFLGALLIAMLIGGHVAATAEEENSASPLLFLGWQDQIKPGKIEAYKEVMKKEIEFWKGNQSPYPFVAYQEGNDFYYITPISTFGEIDRIEKQIGVMIQKWGKEKWADLQRAYAEAVDVSISRIWRLQNNLGYHPAKAFFLPDYSKPFYLHLEYLYLKKGSIPKFTDLTERILSFLREKGDDLPFQFIKLEYGEDADLYVMAITAESKEALEEKMAQRALELGSEFQGMVDEAASMMRKGFERHGLQYLPELSYFPESIQSK